MSNNDLHESQLMESKVNMMDQLVFSLLHLVKCKRQEQIKGRTRKEDGLGLMISSAPDWKRG